MKWGRNNEYKENINNEWNGGINEYIDIQNPLKDE